MERDPMVRSSQFTGSRLFSRRTSAYHTDLRGHRIVLCGCAKGV